MPIINPYWFFAALTVGLLYVYVVTPRPEVVVKFPSPYNAGSVVYTDKNDQCFKYRADAVDCPANKALIRHQPISHEHFRARGTSK